ncbi:glycosyl transferase, partial [Pseudomonas aeruginosa]
MSLWLLLPAVAGLSLLLTAGLRRYAIARSLMDVPNARSSHQVPTPRGGGVAIVLSFLLAVLLAAFLGMMDISLAIGILGAGVGTA